MARRTKKEKVSAKHSFTISWSPSPTHGEPVKSQMISKENSLRNKNHSNKNATLLAKDGQSSSVRFSIVKSLTLASLMLALELVIYLVAK